MLCSSANECRFRGGGGDQGIEGVCKKDPENRTSVSVICFVDARPEFGRGVCLEGIWGCIHVPLGRIDPVRECSLSADLQGYVDAAKVFERESGTSPGVQLGAITDRMMVRRDVQKGDIESAIERVNDLDPAVRTLFSTVSAQNSCWVRLCAAMIDILTMDSMNRG